MIQSTINSLIKTFIDNGFILEEDKTYYTNIVLGRLNLEYHDESYDKTNDVAVIMNKIGDYAHDKFKVNKESFINEISSLLIPSPSTFNKEYHEQKNKQKAFEDFYEKSKDSYYIKYDRVEKNLEWNVNADFGQVDISINLSKPEKTLEEIAAAKLAKDSTYPKCVLCKENIGFVGNAKRPSKQNIRFIEESLNDKKVFMHFSPYGYYDQHLIINNWEHVDMIINDNTIKQLIEFVTKFPFYSIGSNSDIPIVGGSILSHQHYQGGAGNFPLFRSKAVKSIKVGKVMYEALEWPLATIKLISSNRDKIIDKGTDLLKKWYAYSNEKINIVAEKNGNRQNAVTPFARKVGTKYELYLILRNNGTSKEFPFGIFHVKDKIWNIKKENIGIIEAAGKAILPGRLLTELDQIADALKNKKEKLPSELTHHKQWYSELKAKSYTGDVFEFVKQEAGLRFAEGLTHCNVFQADKNAFVEFLELVAK